MDSITQQQMQSYWEGNDVVKAFPLAKTLTLSLACRFFLGTDDPERIARLVNNFDDITVGLPSRSVNLHWVGWDSTLQLLHYSSRWSLTSDNQFEEFTIIAIPQAWDLEPDKQPECFIYRVPRNLRNVNEDAYTPKEISIGPFHHDKENLKKNKKLKFRCFLDVCYRTKKTQGELAKCVKEKELKIRHCYAENFHEISKEDFVKMILLDSVFIIEHFWCATRYPEENNTHEKVSDILHDLILLEN
nr:upf0481 protein [Quercus suber]